MLDEQLLELLDILLFLGLHVAPEFLEVCLAIGVGDVLVVPPYAVQPPAQFVNQVMIVIRAPAGFPDVFIFFLGCQSHSTVPLRKEARESVPTNSAILATADEHNKKTGVVERPEAFRRAGLLFNEPLGAGLFCPAGLLFI
jgi:hypothetical protein